MLAESERGVELDICNICGKGISLDDKSGVALNCACIICGVCLRGSIAMRVNEALIKREDTEVNFSCPGCKNNISKAVLYKVFSVVAKPEDTHQISHDSTRFFKVMNALTSLTKPIDVKSASTKEKKEKKKEAIICICVLCQRIIRKDPPSILRTVIKNCKHMAICGKNDLCDKKVEFNIPCPYNCHSQKAHK